MQVVVASILITRVLCRMSIPTPSRAYAHNLRQFSSLLALTIDMSHFPWWRSTGHRFRARGRIVSLSLGNRTPAHWNPLNQTRSREILVTILLIDPGLFVQLAT